MDRILVLVLELENAMQCKMVEQLVEMATHENLNRYIQVISQVKLK